MHLPFVKKFSKSHPNQVDSIRFGYIRLPWTDRPDHWSAHLTVQYLILDSRTSPTHLDTKHYVQIYILPELVRAKMPNLDYDYVRKELVVNRMDFSLLDAIYSRIQELRRNQRDYILSDYFHPDRTFLENLVTSITTIPGTKHLIVGKPGGGKSTLMYKLEAIGEFDCRKWESYLPDLIGACAHTFYGRNRMIDEFDKLCELVYNKIVQFEHDLKSVAYAVYQNDHQDKQSARNKEYQVKNDDLEALKSTAQQMFTKLFGTPATVILFANDVRIICALLIKLDFTDRFCVPFFRPGRFCPLYFDETFSKDNIIIDFCEFYMPTLKQAQIAAIKALFCTEPPISLLFDFARALGYETNYLQVPKIIDFDYKPSEERFAAVLNQFKTEIVKDWQGILNDLKNKIRIGEPI
jgi:hypothetical protein